MADPLISVITINYNNAAGLKRTVESIVTQTYTGFEYIIIDGGSSDDSMEVIDCYKDKISYQVSEKDAGIYDAMNKGIKVARGKYLLFINSGDLLFEPDTLSLVAPHLSDDADIVYGNMKVDEKGQLTDAFMPPEITVGQMVKDTLWHPVSFIKKELFAEYGLYSMEYKICGDYDFFLQVIKAGRARLKYVNQFICVFELTGISSQASNAELIREEKSKIQRKYLSEKEIRSFSEPKKKPNFFNRWFQ